MEVSNNNLTPNPSGAGEPFNWGESFSNRGGQEYAAVAEVGLAFPTRTRQLTSQASGEEMVSLLNHGPSP